MSEEKITTIQHHSIERNKENIVSFNGRKTMYKRKYRAGDENSAFSQSLKNVQWKFLNERPAPQVETIWSQRASMINEDNNNNYNDNHSRSHYHQNK